MSTGNIPGASAAIVVHAKVDWSPRFAYADVEQERAATADTPLAIASVSKSFIAAAMMQANERGVVSLDTSVNDAGLPFIVPNPSFPGEEITSRELVTQTSGIRDSDAYSCNYYLESSLAPLVNELSPRTCPESSTTHLGEFLEANSTPDGVLHDATANFQSVNEGALGQVWSYSNRFEHANRRVLDPLPHQLCSRRNRSRPRSIRDVRRARACRVILLINGDLEGPGTAQAYQSILALLSEYALSLQHPEQRLHRKQNLLLLRVLSDSVCSSLN